MDPKIDVKGDEALERVLFNAQLVLRELTQAGQKAGVLLHQRASSYPPQRQTTYRRTRRLGNSWSLNTEPFTSGVKSLVSNPVDYAPRVMAPADADPHQAWMHVGFWATTAQIVREKTQQVREIFAEAVGRIMTALRR